jgi:asparagine synthase (glutamine-hydrolysing)
MPGLVIISTRMPADSARAELSRMLAAMRHETFYNSGVWIDEELGLYVGWTAIAGSFSDGGPLVTERGDVVLLFSGEDYTAPSSRRRVAGRAMGDRRSSYLLHFAEQGSSFPAQLNGRFHGLAVDRRHRRVSLFNDRYGMHRLYHHQTTDATYFAAEAKAILAVRPETRAVEPRSLGEVLSCGCVLENRTLFKGIGVLPGGSLWSLENGTAVPGSYFVPTEWEHQPTLSPEQYYEALRASFVECLPRYLDGQGETVGMSLTGGLDTRMIMAWQRQSRGSLPCYTYGSMYRDSRDVTVARQVAATCNQPLTVLHAGSDFLRGFSHYAERAVFLTDGCVGVGHAPDLYLSQQARTVGSVRMTGLYGSEVLRQVRAFKPMTSLPGLFAEDLHPHLDAARKTYENNLAGHPLSFAVFRQAPWHHFGPLAIEQTQLAVRSPFLDNSLVRTVFRAPASLAKTNDISLRLIQDGNLELSKIRTDRGLGGVGTRLVKSASRTLLELSFKAEYAYDYGMPQTVATVDHSLSFLHLERLFLGRHKPFHFRVWYRDFLRDYVREILLDPVSLSRPFVNSAMMRQVVNAHLGGTRNYTTEIHKLLSLELLHRLFVDSRGDQISSTPAVASLDRQ